MARKKISAHQELTAARKRRDAEILRRTAKGETQESIAEDMRMTRQRVGQIIAKARAAA